MKKNFLRTLNKLKCPYCGIFRYGIYKYKTGIYKQLPAHGKKNTN